MKFSLIPPAYAQINNPALPFAGQGGKDQARIIFGNIIGAIVGLLLIGGFLFAFIHLLIGALNWITSGGDKTKLEAAREHITQALVGLIIMAAIWALMVLVGQFTGLGFPVFKVPTFEKP